MPIVVEISDEAEAVIFEKVFSYFNFVDEKFSPFKDSSDVTKFNQTGHASLELQEILELCEQTKHETKGYFDIQKPDGKIDPSGLVKGWAIFNAAKILEQAGVKNFYVEAGGDIEARGKIWSVGIKNPFNKKQIVKVLNIQNKGVATSGTYERRQHIYNPHQNSQTIDEIVSLTVIGSNIYEADRFATAAFAMGRQGIMFIENLPGFEGYMIDKDGIGTETSGLKKYV